MRYTLALVGALSAASSPLMAVAVEDPRLAASRAAAGELQQRLGGELRAAIAAGGPVAAIEICQTRAPAIAAELSKQLQADVGRTALRIRNPANAPDHWQQQALQEFSRQLHSGMAATAVERFEVSADGSARYARAIVTDGPCLACHGAVLAPPVSAALAQRYPQDSATGFAAGELRGAFVVDWPAAKRGEVQ